MDDYIKREDAMNALCDICEENWDCDKSDKAECHKIFMDIPAADVDDVVRCKDCRFSNKSSIIPSLIVCTAANGLVDPSPMCFCNFGERRDENNDD